MEIIYQIILDSTAKIWPYIDIKFCVLRKYIFCWMKSNHQSINLFSILTHWLWFVMVNWLKSVIKYSYKFQRTDFNQTQQKQCLISYNIKMLIFLFFSFRWDMCKTYFSELGNLLEVVLAKLCIAIWMLYMLPC